MKLSNAGSIQTNRTTGTRWCADCGRTLSMMYGFDWCPYCSRGREPLPDSAFYKGRVLHHE